MSTTTSASIRPLEKVAAGEKPTELITGEMRKKLVQLLGQAVSQSKLASVMAVLAKDPSFAWEIIEASATYGGPVSSLPFVVACLKNGLAAGYIFALQHGVDVNAEVVPGASLIDLAVSLGHQSDTATLLALGASPDGLGDKGAAGKRPGYVPPLLSALQREFDVPKGNTPLNPRMTSMLLDAGARARLGDDELLDPISVMVKSPYWVDPANGSVLAQMLGRLVKAGASLNTISGSPKQNPAQRALGLKHGYALVLLASAGADLSEKAIGGDISTRMEKNGLQEFIPLVLKERMRSTMTAKSRELAAQEALGDQSEAAAVTPAQQQDPSVVIAKNRRVSIV